MLCKILTWISLNNLTIHIILGIKVNQTVDLFYVILHFFDQHIVQLINFGVKLRNYVQLD